MKKSKNRWLLFGFLIQLLPFPGFIILLEYSYEVRQLGIMAFGVFLLMCVFCGFLALPCYHRTEGGKGWKFTLKD